MRSSFIAQLNKNGIISAIVFIMALIIGNFSLYCYNRIAFFNSMQAKQDVEAVEKNLDFIWTQVQIADMGVRGYLLVPEELMAVPLHESIERYQKGFQELEQTLAKQQYSLSNLQSFKKLYDAKMDEALLMKELQKEGKGEQALEVLKKDSGYQLWLVFKSLREQILAFEYKLKEEADNKYNNSLANTLIVQVVLLLLSMPALGMVIYRLLQNEWQKKALFEKLTDSTKKYLFCKTDQQVELDEETIITGLVSDLQTASQFVKDTAKGNYEQNWKGIDDTNAHLNRENLTGHLIQMREQMKLVKEEDRKRLWANQGFARFADLIRQQADSLEDKIHHFLAELIKYVHANQGAVFLVVENESETVLELKACYAYGKKKFIKKSIHPGEGLAGQAFLEKDKIWITDVPQDYISISSGLGEALPSCLLVVPLKYSEQVVGILELASFQVLETYQIEFIEKVLENLASLVVSERVHIHTKVLLEEASQRAELMQAQEEEMRQNMEELEATQEEMRRNELAHLQEITRLEQVYQSNTELLQKKDSEMSGVLSAVDTTLAMIEFDLNGYILTANKRFLQVMGYALNEITGSHHSIFVEKEYKESAAYQIFWQELAQGKEQIGEVKRCAKNGKEVWLSASYTPVFDQDNRVIKIIKFAQDITRQKHVSLDYQSQLQAISKSNSVIEFDLSGHILSANTNFLTLMNYQEEEITGKHHRIFVLEKERESEEYQLFWENLRNGEYISGEFRRVTKEGKYVWIKGSYNPISDINGKVYKVVKYAQDVTAQKLLEQQALSQTEELRAQEEEIRQNLEELQATQDEVERKSLELQAQIAAVDSSMATIEFDLYGNILRANTNFLNLMGYTMEEIVHQPHRIFVEKAFGESKEYQDFWQELKAGKAQIGKVKRFTKSGKQVWLNASYTPVFDMSNTPVKIIKLAQHIEVESAQV